VPKDDPAGDLQKDGEHETGLHRAGTGSDNVQSGTTGERVPEAYELDSSLFWMIKPGSNELEGGHDFQYHGG